MRRVLLGLLAVTLSAGVMGCEPKDPKPGFVAAPSDLPVPTPAQEPTPTTGTPSTAPKPAPTSSPSGRPTTRPKPTTSPKPVDCQQGDQQLVVERALIKLGGYGHVTADGKQSAADCAAIKKFQHRFDIRPANGRAGPMTGGVAQRLAASNPASCGAGSGLTACVDLTHQTVWIMNGGKLVYGPTVTRTGMKGYATPSGTYSIYDRQTKNWSEEWKVWLPYWQRIVDGMGFHQTTTYIHNSAIGSHGCVNLLPVDAVKFWNTLSSGTTVKMFGRRPGT
jgi:hypothetical protein